MAYSNSDRSIELSRPLAAIIGLIIFVVALLFVIYFSEEIQNEAVATEESTSDTEMEKARKLELLRESLEDWSGD